MSEEVSKINDGNEKKTLSKESIAKMIDHTLLKPTATQEQIISLCKEAVENNFEIGRAHV